MLSFIFFILYIVLFIGGMIIVRTGLINLAGERIKQWLISFTDTPFKGFIFGILVTILLQSSSAVMVITVGLISAKILNFHQSIGIILGTNIGTTATVEFLAYGTDQLIFPLLFLGSVLILIQKKGIQHFGLFLFGLGAIFFSMFGFERLAGPISETKLFEPLLTAMNEHLMVAVISGTFITAIIQSSTALIGILMGFVHANILSLFAAIGAMLGANIGTCVDAFIASIGGGKEAKMAAYAHIWLNIFGVLMFLPFLAPFSYWLENLTPYPEQQLAHASVIFNCIVSLVFLPFSKPFAKLIEAVHKK